MRARGLHRQAGADRLEQREQLARLVGRGVLRLGLIEPVVVEQAAAEVVGQALALRDPDLGEQTVRGLAAGGLVDHHEALLRIAAHAGMIARMPRPAWSASQMRW